MSPLTSRGWPEGLSLGVPFSYGVVSPSDPGFVKVAIHNTDPSEAILGRVQSHERGWGGTFVIVIHGT